MLPYNLDVMHIEKNICENIIDTLPELGGMNKDTINTRVDLHCFKSREAYWSKEYPKKKNSYKTFPAPWTLSKEGKKRLCKFWLTSNSQMVMLQT